MTEDLARSGPVTAEPLVRRGAGVPDDPQLSICILVLDHAGLALECLDSLRQPGASPPGTELVVVANGTPSDQVERLRGCNDVVLVVNEENLGFAAGCNQAASVANSSFLIFLNDDSTVAVGCIDALIATAATDPTIGAVGARLLSVHGTLEEAGSVIWRDGSTTHVGEGLPSESDRFREQRDVDYASANGLLVTRRAWDAVGGFDERYFPAYFEDVDLCVALAEHGFRTTYEPRALVFHRGSQSTSPTFRGFLMSRNQRLFVEKWGSALDRFEPPPTTGSGWDLDAAITRALKRAVGRFHAGAVPARPARDDSLRPPVSAGPARAAALEAEYLDYLEERVADRDRRITTLETYLSRLWGVRFRRWAWGRLQRRSR